jgi:hypothetical protein
MIASLTVPIHAAERRRINSLLGTTHRLPANCCELPCITQFGSASAPVGVGADDRARGASGDGADPEPPPAEALGLLNPRFSFYYELTDFPEHADTESCVQPSGIKVNVDLLRHTTERTSDVQMTSTYQLGLITTVQ